MRIEYEYNNKVYSSEYAVRHALGQNGILFGDVPEENVDAFWSKLSVTRKEVPEPKKTEEEISLYNLNLSKRMRNAHIAALSVEVDGLVFDADELSQNRMLATVYCLENSKEKSVEWVLEDNSVQTVTLDQLKQALAKANKITRDTWPRPYIENAH